MRAAERKQAKLEGRSQYFTGKPCRAGHVANRSTSNGECLACAAERQKAAIAANPEREKAKQARYRAAHPERCREKVRAWSARNKAHVAAYNKRVRVEKPEFFLPYASKRRARLRAATGSFTHSDVERIHRLQRGRCAGCRVALGTKYHRDHIVPLALGGSNQPTNIQLMCRPCNLSKSAKHPTQWAAERGLLL